MLSYLKSNLPNSVATSVNAYGHDKQRPAQYVREFCAHYKENPSALDHFSLKELEQSPELWFISHDESQLRSEWLTEVYPKHIEPVVDTFETVLKCGKCGKNTVDYYEKQTRGADEPMTLFANCLSCHHRWRQ